MTHHLPFPQGLSLNDGISSEFTSVSYATLEDAIHTIGTVGRGCFMAKTDIKNAFQIIPIQPQDYHLLGIRWRDLFLMLCQYLGIPMAPEKTIGSS